MATEGKSRPCRTKQRLGIWDFWSEKMRTREDQGEKKATTVHQLWSFRSMQQLPLKLVHINAFLKPTKCCSGQAPTSAIVSKYTAKQRQERISGRWRTPSKEIQGAPWRPTQDPLTFSFYSKLRWYIVDARLKRTSTSTIMPPFHPVQDVGQAKKCTWSLRACRVLRRRLVSSVSFRRSSSAKSRLVASDAPLADAWGASFCVAGSPATTTGGCWSEDGCTPLVTVACWEYSASFPEAPADSLRAARKSLVSRRQLLSTSVKWCFARSVATSARSRPSSASFRLVRAWRSSPRAAWGQRRQSNGYKLRGATGFGTKKHPIVMTKASMNPTPRPVE